MSNSESEPTVEERPLPVVQETSPDQPATEILASILESVPAENEGAKDPREICLTLGVDPDHWQRALNAVFTLLIPFEVLDISKNPEGLTLVKASTRYGLLFLRSYAAYLREGKSILTNWGRGGNPDGPYFARETLSGPEFLYLIERQRSAGRKDVIPLRETDVSQVIIKAHVRGLKGDAYLMQFDSVAQQFQLIGGHRRSADPDDQIVAVRELEEELPKNQFYIGGRDSMTYLSVHTMTRMSRAYGVTTRYRFSFFQLKMSSMQLKLGPADRWVSEAEISSGTTRDGSPIAIDAIGALDVGLPGGIKGLPLSLDDTQKRRIREIAGEHRWEASGLLIGIIGIIITVILFFLS